MTSFADQPVATFALRPVVGSAIHPLVEEVSWVAWRMAHANPHALTSALSAGEVRGCLDEVLESLHDPGRIVFFSQISAWSQARPDGLDISFAVGAMGPKHESALEAVAAAQVVEATCADRVGFPYQLEPIEPLGLLESCHHQSAHSGIVRQVMRPIQIGDQRMEVLSRFNPAQFPVNQVASLLLGRPVPTTVRATVLATGLAVSDHLYLDRGLAQVDELSKRNLTHPEERRDIERAGATLVDTRASFMTPIFACEIACVSEEHMPTAFLHSIGSAYTSDLDVVRRQARVVVANSACYLGGFELERDQERLQEALGLGIPVRGGLTERSLRDLVSLTESPVGWPVPHSGRAIPTISSRAYRIRPVPQELSEGSYIGIGPGGAPVHIPDSVTNHHVLVTGESGSGKSRFGIFQGLETLKSDQGLLYVDPHGTAAQHLGAHAAALSRKLTVLSAVTDRGSVLSPIPALDDDHHNYGDVAGAIGQFADAIAGTFPELHARAFRWRQYVMVIGMISAGYRMTFGEAIERFADQQSRTSMVGEGVLPETTLRSLRLLNAAPPSEMAQLVDLTISRFDLVLSGVGHRLLAAPGEGLDVASLMNEGRSLIIDLSGLINLETRLIGGICLSAALGVAKARRISEPYRIIVDDAHLIDAQLLASILADGKRCNLSPTLIAQSLLQFPDVAVREAAANAAVKLAFRQSATVAGNIAEIMGVEPADLSDQPDFHACVKVGRLEATTAQLPPYEPLPAVQGQQSSTAACRRQTALNSDVAESEPGGDNGQEMMQSHPATLAPWINEWLRGVKGANPSQRDADK